MEELETLWVLSSVYAYKRNEIINAVESLSLMPIIEFEKVDAVQEFIRLSRNTKYELDDLLIGMTAKHSGCESTITFDLKKLSHMVREVLQNPASQN